MSYLLESFTVDELVLLIASEDGESRPEAYDERDPDYDIERWGIYGTTKGIPPRRARGFVYLNITDSLREAYDAHLFYENPRQYRVIHLTWKGWDRVEQAHARGIQPARSDATCDEAVADRKRHDRERQERRARERRESDRAHRSANRWWRRAFAPTSSRGERPA